LSFQENLPTFAPPKPRLQTLAEDPERLEAMRESTRETLHRFSLETLDQNLRAVEKKLRPGGEGDLAAAPFF
jgi:hypothetical protein